MTEKERRKRGKALARQGKRFYKRLNDPGSRVPSLFELMVFRMARTSMRLTLDDSNLDYSHYSEHGWFDSDYYYPVRLGLLKKSAGKIFDAVFTVIYKARAASAAAATRP